jgi:hypothetical protein
MRVLRGVASTTQMLCQENQCFFAYKLKNNSQRFFTSRFLFCAKLSSGKSCELTNLSADAHVIFFKRNHKT